jgi:hypothetical protein
VTARQNVTDELFAWLKAMPNTGDISYALRKADQIKAWCLRSLDFKVGDRVRIAQPVYDPDRSPRWAPYREALAVGRTGIVHDIDFNPYSGEFGGWSAAVKLDHEWSVSDWKGCTRWWSGPAETTPERFNPPSQYDQEKHPEGRMHTFGISVERLERCEEPAPAPVWGDLP